MIHSPMPGLRTVVLWQSLGIARKQLLLFKRSTLLVQMCTATRQHSSNSVVGWWHLDCTSDPPYPRIRCIDGVLRYTCNAVCCIQYCILHAMLYAAYNIVHRMQYCMLHTTLYTACNAICCIQHCILHAILYAAYNIVYRMQCCMLHTTLYTACNAVRCIQHCTPHAMLYAACNIVYRMQYYTLHTTLYTACSAVCCMQYCIPHAILYTAYNIVYRMQCCTLLYSTNAYQCDCVGEWPPKLHGPMHALSFILYHAEQACINICITLTDKHVLQSAMLPL